MLEQCHLLVGCPITSFSVLACDTTALRPCSLLSRPSGIRFVAALLSARFLPLDLVSVVRCYRVTLGFALLVGLALSEPCYPLVSCPQIVFPLLSIVYLSFMEHFIFLSFLNILKFIYLSISLVI
jgi:hypothetical protein